MTEQANISPEGTAALKRLLDRSLALVDLVQAGDEPSGTAVATMMAEQRDDAKAVREELERAAESGEPEPARKLRWILKRIEAASDVLLYSWQGGDLGYDPGPWTELLAPAIRELAEELQGNWNPAS